ncbi:MAG: hypothetical protein U0841_18890 [Chloroflexia bacterium]
MRDAARDNCNWLPTSCFALPLGLVHRAWTTLTPADDRPPYSLPRAVIGGSLAGLVELGLWQLDDPGQLLPADRRGWCRAESPVGEHSTSPSRWSSA